MIAKTVTYTDYDGNEVSEKLYFNLNVMELRHIKFEGIPERVSIKNYLEKLLKEIKELSETDNADEKEAKLDIVYSLVEQLIVKSYGVKTDDGRSFMKSKEIAENFRNSAAFESIYIDFLTNPSLIPDFVNGILPKNAMDKINAANGSGAVILPEVK